jgi:CDP-diacylglycerol--glycerol-3-phosphate 3-phosphatidyltransferase
MKAPGIANLITLARFAFILLAAVCIASYTPDRDYYRGATIGLVALAILSDILDGKVARRLKQESYLGGILDAAADALGFTLGFIFLSFFDLGMRFPLWFVAIVVGREVVVYGLFLAVILKKGRVDKKPSRLAKWNTTLLALCVLLLLFRLEYAWPLWALASVTTVVTGIDNVVAAIKALTKTNNEEKSETL